MAPGTPPPTSPSTLKESSSSPTYASPSPSHSSINVDAVFQKLVDLGFYIAGADLLDNVAWVPGGCTGDRLVTKTSVNDTDPVEVSLTLVGEISYSNSWLSPEGAYRPGSIFDNHITTAKAKFDVGPPTDPRFTRFASDWETGVANIFLLHEKALKEGEVRTNRKEPMTIKPSRITIRHPLVIRREDIPPEKDVEATGEPVPGSSTVSEPVRDVDPLSFEGWPVGKNWRTELDGVKETHDINPMPAYDVDHSLITPKDYGPSLRGAIVEVHFTLLHYDIGRNGSTLSAELRELIVLRPPRRVPRSPMKRKLADGPSSVSPKKRRV